MTTRKSLLLDFFSRHKGATAALFGSLLAANLSLVLIPLLIGKYYDVAFGYHAFRARLLEWTGLQDGIGPGRVIALLSAVILVHALAVFASRAWTRYLGERVALEIRGRIFAHLIEAPLRRFDRRPTGKFLSYFAGDIKSIRNLVTQGIIRRASDALFIAVFLAALAALHLRLTLLLSTMIPAAAGLVFLFGAGLRDAAADSRGRQSRLLGFASTRLGAILTLKAFVREEAEKSRFEKLSRKLMERAMKFHLIDSLAHAAGVALLYFMLLGILVAAGRLAAAGTAEVSGGLLIAYVTLLLIALPFFRRGLRAGGVWSKGGLALGRLVDALNRVPESAGRRDRPVFRNLSIEFRKVSFGYLPEEDVIRDLTCVFGAGKLTKISGRTGTGKSTVLKLILGLYSPARGEILVGGEDITRFDPKLIREEIALVSPEAPLLGPSVLDAVAGASDPAAGLKAKAIIKHFRLGPFLGPAADPDFKIGEFGKNLSTGQRTALMLVRALMTEKPILLLDEPFNGLDVDGRACLWQVLLTLKGGKTIVLVDPNPTGSEEIDHTVILTHPQPLSSLTQTF